MKPADDVAAFSYIDAYGWANAQCPPKHTGTGEGPDKVHWGIDEWGCRYVRNGGGGEGGSERETQMHTPSLHHSHTRTYRFVTREPYHEEALLFTTGDDSTGSYMADGDTEDSTTTSSPTSSSSMSSTTGKAGSDAPSKLPTPRTPRESRGACDVAWHRIRRWSREICHGIGCQGYDR